MENIDHSSAPKFICKKCKSICGCKLKPIQSGIEGDDYLVPFKPTKNKTTRQKPKSKAKPKPKKVAKQKKKQSGGKKKTGGKKKSSAPNKKNKGAKSVVKKDKATLKKEVLARKYPYSWQ